MTRTQKLALVYLYLVPPIAAAIGFGIAPIRHQLYIPIWAVHVCLMLIAASLLISSGRNELRILDKVRVGAAFLIIIPWLLFSIFAGMGPPPGTMDGWVASATEQQVRYSLLIAGGLSAFFGFALLKTELQAMGENVYASLGLTSLGLALPLFILNMAYWGYYLPEAFRIFVHLPTGKRPDWYVPLKSIFYVISCLEVALTYLSSIFFARAMRKTGMLSKRSLRCYAIFGTIGLLLVFVPPSWPEPLSIASYLVAVPAIPFIMPYFMGVRLLHFFENSVS